MAQRRTHQVKITVQGQSTSMEMDKDVFTVGRTPGSDVVIGADVVSKKHLEFTIRNGRASVRDLGSRNGTRLDGLALQPGIAYPVQSESEIRIGDDSVVITVQPAPVAERLEKTADTEVGVEIDGIRPSSVFQTTVQPRENAPAAKEALAPTAKHVAPARLERARPTATEPEPEPARREAPPPEERSSDKGSEAARTRRRLDETEDKLVRLLASLSIAEDELSRVRRDCIKETEQIEAKRHALDAEKETVSQMVSELDRRDADLVGREEAFRKHQEIVNAELAEAQERVARLDEEADKALSECERARAEIIRSQESLEAFERQREDAEKRHAAEIADYEAREAKLKTQFDNLEAEAQTARIKTEGETEKLASLKRANEEEIRLHELKLQKQALDSSMAVTKAEQALTNILDRTQASIQESERARATLEECRIEKTRMEEQLRALRATTEAELANARDKQQAELAHAAQAQSRDLTEVRRAVEAEIAELRQKAESDISEARRKCEAETAEARRKCEAELSAHRHRVESELLEAHRKCEAEVSAARGRIDTDIAAAHEELDRAQKELIQVRKTADDIKNHGTEEIDRRIQNAKEIEATAKDSAARLMEKTRAEAAAFAKASSDKLHSELADQGTKMEADLAARRIEALNEIERTRDRENRATETKRRTQAEHIVRRAIELADSAKLVENPTAFKDFVIDILQGKMPEVSSIAAERRTKEFWRKVQVGAAVCAAPVLLYLAFPQAPKGISNALRRTIAGSKDDSGAFLEQIRSKGAIYRPEQDSVFRASYTENTLFLEGYVEFKLNETHQRDWTLALSTFFTKTLGLDDRVVVEFIAAETVLIKELARVRESTVEQFKDQGRTRMEDMERAETAKLAAMLKTRENFEKFRMFEKSFFESGGAKP